MRFNPPLNMARMSTQELRTLAETTQEPAIASAVRRQLDSRLPIVFLLHQLTPTEREVMDTLNLIIAHAQRLEVVQHKRQIPRHPW